MSVPQAELIQQHLHQALSSSLFRNADRQASLLRFVVTRALEDSRASLKEFEIGMEVYNRGINYDPRVDPIVRVELREQLGQLVADLKKTVVMVTHDVREAARLGHAITLLTAGRVVQQGTYADLAERPASPFVTQFLTAQAAPTPGA